MEVKLKKCPLLIQRDTTLSLTVAGESYTRTVFSDCLGQNCAAYAGGNCERFGTIAVNHEEKETRH